MNEPESQGFDCEDWDEHDWERFLQQADVRTAKYQELYETLVDHPERDKIIAQEMGWERFFKERCRDKRGCDSCSVRSECEAYILRRLFSDAEEEATLDEFAEEFKEIQRIPAFQKGHLFSLRLQAYVEQQLPPSMRQDEDVLNMLHAASLVPAQIAGGHGIGYERDSICGNIANCKRALRNAEDCAQLVARLRDRGIISGIWADELLREARELHLLVARWIEELRSRIWWR